MICFHFSVAKWASQIGDELWELAQIMTKSKEIKAVSNAIQSSPYILIILANFFLISYRNTKSTMHV